ncbi:MAG: sodium:solute symporter family protein [Candidatus Cardinium sp.]|uniref:sodium:solute symporter family protein n=1 Tax=Cardinium endosymbiont of Dermatophagoides farinae TaxID=2597823 RepID=UPI001183C890|nr:sodium:solute symporter family protein [Cardinium endosymbiont of Dermatophagoides farinae]TSJ81407.1 sodium:solute symporter family protein [Cardinium endosymbiont of Dermatophagoides farinae]UWW97469.1 MAG: sodium:solute symporter family protein [Candidatus Cardinium sp.]
MTLYNVPLLMVLSFLGLTLVVGLYGTQKAITFRKYAVGNKRFHTTTLVITVLATACGGGMLMRELPNIYKYGIHHIAFLLIINAMKDYIISLLGFRMGPFMTHFSIAETIGSVYGKYPRVIAALLSICFSIGVVAIQINVMSLAIGMCIESIDPRIVTVPATLILIVYSMFGGVRSVTITDILQFITIPIIILLIIKFVFVKIDKSFLEVALLIQKQEKFQFSRLFQFDKKLLTVFLNSLWYGFFLYPPVIQRVYMSSGPIQAHKVFLRFTRFKVIILGCIALISVLVFIGDPTLPLTAIWPYILADILPVYKGCLVIGLLAMAMSTVDSSLHTASIMVSHDIVESIRGVKSVSYVHQLRLAKLTTLVLGLLAMTVTIYYPDLFKLTNFALTFLISFFVIAVIPPFILAVFGFRGSTRTALIGIATGTLVYFYSERWIEPAIGIPFKFFALIANGLAMIAAHYLLSQPADKGWTGNNNQQKRMQQLIRVFKKYKKSIELE